MEQKRLSRSLTDRKLCGVCGGIAEYINMDTTVVRLIWAVLVFSGGVGIPLYFVAAIIMPE